MEEEMINEMPNEMAAQPQQPAETTQPSPMAKQKLVKSFLDKVKEKKVLTQDEAATTAELAAGTAAEAGRQQGIEEGVKQVLNPQNIKVKKNNYKQSVVAGISAGPAGGVQ